MKEREMTRKNVPSRLMSSRDSFLLRPRASMKRGIVPAWIAVPIAVKSRVGTRLETKNTSATSDVPKYAAMMLSRANPSSFPRPEMIVTSPTALMSDFI